jgi:hypothetical protein
MGKLKFDCLIDRVAAQNNLIVRAHEELGIPLEDLICAAVRRAASLKVVDLRQEELPLEDTKQEGRRG